MTDYLIEALGEWPKEYAQQQHLAWMHQGRTHTVTVDDQIIGSTDDAWNTDALHVVRMEIDPRFQGRGIGSAILSDLLVQAE